MADSKVSELVAATSAGGSDVLYLVQSNTSKKITVANLFGNISNPTFTGNVVVGGTPQTLSAPGIVSLTTPITHLTIDAVGGTLNIPQGSNGQVKILTVVSSSGGTYSVNTANIAGNTTIELDTAGDTVVLVYTNSKWAPISSTSALDLSSVAANIIPSADSTFNLGSPSNQWKSLYVSNNTIFIGGTAVTVDGGELIVGSGEASANLATVSYVDAAVANVGGGDVSSAFDAANTAATIASAAFDEANTKVTFNNQFAIDASESINIAYTDGSTSESVFSAEQGRASISIIDTGTPGAKIELKTSNVIINNGQGSNPIDLEVSGNVIVTDSFKTSLDGNATFTVSSGYGRVRGDEGAELYHESGNITVSMSIGGDPAGAGIQVIDLTPGSSTQTLLEMDTESFTLSASNSVYLRTNYGPNVRDFAFTEYGLIKSPVMTWIEIYDLAEVGQRAFISDADLEATAANFGEIVGGGGSNIAPVWSDGFNWRIG